MRLSTVLALPCLLVALAWSSSSAPKPPRMLREELFALELDGAADGARELGVASLRATAYDGAVLLECELRFAADSVRVLHSERWEDDAIKLVWRELGLASGRSILAEVERRGTHWRIVDWGAARERDALDLDVAARTPLQLFELARRQSFDRPIQLCFDPLSARLETLKVAVCWTDELARSVELERGDGTAAYVLDFEGDQLRTIRWQRGGVVARRIDPAEHAARCAQLDELAP